MDLCQFRAPERAGKTDEHQCLIAQAQIPLRTGRNNSADVLSKERILWCRGRGEFLSEFRRR